VVSFPAASAGNLLVMVACSTAAINSFGSFERKTQTLSAIELSVYSKTADASENSVSITLSAANYPLDVVVYEFDAGSAYVAGIGADNLAFNAANPNLTGLTGTNLTVGAIGFGAAPTAVTTAWTAPAVEDLDTFVANAGTDGYLFSVAYVEDNTAGSFQPIGIISTELAPSKQAVTFAVNVA
jgi:hypothetical protein